MNIIFLGAPGSGKGTQAEKVSAKLGIPTISTGAIIRNAIKNGTEMGKAAVPFIEKGQLVPDEVVIGIIKERLADADCAGGFILDGFPRTLPQAEALDAMGVAIDMAINLDVPDETIISRMGGRRVCDKCGASYHVEFVPSKDGVHCDHCQTPLTCRQDDLPEVVKNRLDIYHAQSEPLIAYYEKQGKLKTVVGQRELADTTKLIFEAVESGFGR